MDHSIEVIVYVLNHPNDIEFDENILEVTFDMDNNGWEITGYLLDGKDLEKEELNELYKNNPSLDKRIDRTIDHYITNHEEEFCDYDR